MGERIEGNLPKHLPSFFVVGAQKAGTTSLHGWLKRHPSIRLPKVKETHFFSDDEKYSRGIAWYQEQFDPYQEGQITGEVAPQYMYSEEAPSRISQWVQNPKFIFLLRHPIERAFSNYLMTVRQGHEPLGFYEALASENGRLQGGGRFARDHYGYMARGRYCEQIARYRRYFPNSKMLFTLFDDIVDTGKRGQIALNLISQLLELNPVLFEMAMEKENPSSRPRSLLLRDLLYKSSIWKRPVRWLIPSRNLREKLAYFLDAANQEPLKLAMGAVPAQVIDEATNEIESLENMLAMDLGVWKARTAAMTAR